MQKEYIKVPIDSLVPYENNPRINDEAVPYVEESINQVGYITPIVIDENNIILAGHTRLKALMASGEVDEIEVLKVSGLSEEQKKKYRLLDNKTGEKAEWDFSKLEQELADLDFDGFDFDFTVKEQEIDGRQIQEESQYEDDEYVEKEEYSLDIQHGDVFKLGNHFLMCGDSTSAEDIAVLMDGMKGKAKILFTSPPYSDIYEYEGGKNLEESHIATFISAYRPYTDYQCVNLGIKRKEHDIVEYWNEYINEARKSGYKMLAWNVWDKGTSGSIGMATALFPIRHEFIFVFGTKFFEINCTIEKKPESIGVHHKKTMRQRDGSTKEQTWGDTSKSLKQMESVLLAFPEMRNDIRKKHPAVFPIDLPSEYIKSMTQKNDTVIEPFGGSGTTLIACEQLGRKCRIMEYEPKYVNVIIDRWEQFTGGKAERV